MAEEVMLALEGRIQQLADVLQVLVRDYAPNHLKSYVFVKASIAATRATLSVRVENTNPVQKYGSADAAAQEYGMGGQNVRGDSKFYGYIFPVNGTYLVFEGTHDWAGQIIHTTSVQHHPGSPPFEHRGYLGPAINEFKGTVLPSIDPNIKDAVNIAVRKSFPGALKK